MKKTYWWRITLFAISIIALLLLYAGPCDLSFSECSGSETTYTMVFRIFFAFFIISPFLFFVNDGVFKKWFKFSAIWVVLTLIIIGTANGHKYKNFGEITYSYKAYISLLLFEIYILVSFIKIIWDSFMSRRRKDDKTPSFSRASVVRSWLLFTAWLAFLYYFMQLSVSKTNGGWIFPSDYELINVVFPVVFLFVSLCIIMHSWYKLRKIKQ